MKIPSPPGLAQRAPLPNINVTGTENATTSKQMVSSGPPNGAIHLSAQFNPIAVSTPNEESGAARIIALQATAGS